MNRNKRLILYFLLLTTVTWNGVKGQAEGGENVCGYSVSVSQTKAVRRTKSCYIVSRCSYYEQSLVEKEEQRYKCCENWIPAADDPYNCAVAICDQRRGSLAGTCQNGGTCLKPGHCTCPQTAGVNAYDCSDIDECSIQNGGCSHTCENTVGSFQCACPDGYGLMDQRTCRPSCYGFDPAGSCPNRGRCDAPNECKCRPGFQSDQCDDIDECADSETISCSQLCVNTHGGYYCDCREGFSLINEDDCAASCFGLPAGECPNKGTCVGSNECECMNGFVAPNCTDKDECDEENGLCSQHCENLPGTYRCSCDQGYRLSIFSTIPGHCEPTCFENDSPGGCLNNHKCVGPNECECTNGFQGPRCHDTDECESNHTCQQLCDNLIGSFRCACEKGYELAADGNTCLPVCSDCPNKSSCIEPEVCKCLPGYSSPKCEDVNECNGTAHACDQVCVNTDGSYTCQCRDGFQLDKDTTSCLDVNECNDTAHDCDQVCVNTDGSYKCQCRDGFQLDKDSTSCLDINECSIEGTCSQRCIDTAGSYRCACYSGFAKDQNDDCKAVCGDDVSTPGQCMNGGKCLEPDVCECYNGFAGSLCQVSDQCENNNGGCSHECLISSAGVKCTCPSGYGLVKETNCEAVCSDGLVPGVCMNGGRCVEPEKCQCEPGFIGDLCQDISYCGNNKGGCSHDCIEVVGGFRCACPAGYQLLDDKNCGDADECEVFKPCEDECVNTVGSYTCHCKEGYDLVKDHDCQDRDECLSNPCIQVCENTPGSYVCKCREDHVLLPDGTQCVALNLCPDNGSFADGCAPLCTGRPCVCPASLQLHTNGKHCIDPCATKPCQHGGMCLANWDEGYRCACWEVGYMGDHCETGIISMPDNLNARVGEIYPNIQIQAKPEEEIIFTLANYKDKLQVNPNPISVSKEHSTKFGLLVSDRGLYNVTFEISGASADDFENNKTVYVRADDVFSRLSLRNQTLPKGCFWYELSFQEQTLWFLSTSYWYRANLDPAVYTFGVVMLVHGDLSLPISSDGIHILTGLKLALMAPQLSKVDGLLLENGKNVNCQELLLSDRDMKELRESRSLFWSLFTNLGTILPYYVQLSPVDELRDETTQFRPQILSGNSIQQLDVCKGAPTSYQRFYLVFNFQDPFIMTLLEEHFQIPEGDSCLIVDLFIPSDPTVTILFSDDGGAKFSQMRLFESLEQQSLITYSLTGFSVSRAGNIILPSSAGDLQFWNGGNLFKYPFEQKAVVWSRIAMNRNFTKTGGGFDFKLSASMQAFMANINPETIFTHLFVNPREVFIELEAFTAHVEFKIFGQQRTLKILDVMTKRYGILALGGDGERTYCGKSANPPGVFVRVSVELKLFEGTPILEDFTFSSYNELYFFKTFPQGANEGAFSTNWQNLTDQYISVLKTTNQEIQALLRNWKQQSAWISPVQFLYRQMVKTSENISKDIELLTGQDFAPLSIADFTKISTRNIANLQRIYFSLRDLLSIELDRSLDSILESLSQPIHELRKQSGDVVRQLYEATLPFFPDQGTWGFKGSFSVTILGVLFQLDGEVVFSDENVLPCNTRFSEFYEHLKGETAVRVFGMVSGRAPLTRSALSWGPLFWKYLTPHIGFGIELALSPDKFNFVCRLHVEWTLLGLKTEGDIIVSTKGIAASIEGSLWGIFRARLTVGAKYSMSPADWFVWMQADFLPGADDSFQGSMWDAVRKVAKNFGQTADERLQAAEKGLQSTKAFLSQSQDKVEKAKQAMLSKKSLLDQAISKLEQVKVKLENAKSPFKAANSQLTDLQNNLDQMCQIQSCDSVCVRGLKLVSRCPYLWYKVPCLVTSKCAFKVKSPRCVASNVVCRIKRGLAYAALGVAKAAIRVPMFALDVAKAGLTASQIIVDKSRILFDAAGGLYDGAKLALKGAEQLADVAQKGVSKLKVALNAGLSLLDAFIKNKLQTYIDFKECGFKSSLSAADGTKMEIYCNVNFMSSGWKEHRFVIDFKNVLSSLWKLAKHYLNKVLQQITVGKRKKREATRLVLSNFQRIFRRDASTTNGIELDTTLKFWETQCENYKPVISFIKDSLELLLNISEKVYRDASEAEDNSTSYFKQFDIKSHVNSIASEPDFGNGYAELGISTQQVGDALKNVDIEADDIGQAFVASITDVKSLEQDTIRTLRNYLIIVHWKEEMENFTTDTFSKIFPCFHFQDCMVFALGKVDMLMTSIDPSLILVPKARFDDFKKTVDNIMKNDTQIAEEMPSVSVGLLDDLQDIDVSDIFCATMPEIQSNPNSSVAVEGNMTSLTCMADALPEPDYQWYKDDQELIDGNTSIIRLVNVTLDHEGLYKCVAKNHIGSVTSSAAFLDVQFAPKIMGNLPSTYYTVTGGAHALTCNVSADPEAHVVWYSTESDQPVANGASLVLNGNDSSPPLLYKCFANNTHGRSESEEVLVTKTSAIPACPIISLDAEYIQAPTTTNTNPILTQNPANAGYDNLFKLSISSIVTAIDSDIVIKVPSIEQSTKIVSISLLLPCGNMSSCSLAECQDIFTSMEQRLTEALIQLRQIITNDTAFFNLKGQTFYLKSNTVKIGQQRVCPELYIVNSYGICVLNKVELSLAPPGNLKVVNENGDMVVRWTHPVYAEQFIKVYQVTMVRKMDGTRTTVNVSGSDNFLVLGDSYRLEEYDVRVSAFTDSHQSELAGSVFDLSQVAVKLPSDTENSNVGVAVGVAVSFCILLIALAIIARRWYRSKQKKSGSVSSLASTVSTNVESMDSGSEGIGQIQPVKAAWLPLVAGDKVKIPRRAPSTFT